MRHGFPLCLALALAGCADTTPPSFAAGSTLALEASAHRIVASWPAATDDRSVAAYLVRVDGTEAARVGATETSYELADLPDLATRAVVVAAVDEAGNESAALEASATTPDTTPPAFADGATLVAQVRTTLAGRAVALSWDGATDEGGGVRYEVRTGAEVVDTVDALELTIEVAVPPEGVAYELVAVDAAGNRSSSLRASVSAAPPPGPRMRPSTESFPPAADLAAGGRAAAERLVTDALAGRDPVAPGPGSTADVALPVHPDGPGTAGLRSGTTR